MKHAYFALLAFVIAPLACCAQTRDFPGHITYLPNGSPAYAITCDGPFDDMGTCYKRAGMICLNTGYTVVSASPRAPDLPDPIAQFKRSLMIRCRTQDGLYPADRNALPR
jgi:hypothetical protein